MQYPDREDTVDLLATAARAAVTAAGSTHPEDIAIAMITAIESSWPVVLESYRKFST